MSQQKKADYNNVHLREMRALTQLDYDKIIKNLNNEYILVELCIFITIFVELKRLIRVCGDRAFSILS